MASKILIIDDDQDIRVQVGVLLSQRGYLVAEAEDGERGVAEAAAFVPDLILLDINMPGMNGLEVCRQLRSDPKNVFAIVMLTADGESEVKGLESGADDYVVKPFQKEVLLARIRRGLEIAGQRQDAHVDSLTSIFNRRTFNSFLLQEEGRAIRYGRPLSAVMVDLDHFKNVNDSHGHEAGDVVLAAVAGILRHICRRSDLLARFGGEEFVVLLPETDAEDAIRFAEKARAKIEAHSFPGVGRVTASFGVAELRKDDEVGMMRRADRALYKAKNSGRNRVAVDRLADEADGVVTLLVVDDDEAIRELIRVKMMYRGYDVQVADSGAAAFRVLQEHDVDMVLIDQEMPGRDGMETFMSIREERPDLPAIMITAHGSKHLIKSFFISGGRDFIEKPIVDFDSFEFRIKRVLQEIEKEREAERKLREAMVFEESRRVKDVFLASMSHELRTPLSHILGFSQRLRKSDCATSDKHRNYLAQIIESAESLSRIVGDILEVSLIESNMRCKTEEVFLPEVVARVGKQLAGRIAAKGLELHLSLPEDLPSVIGDGDKLAEVVEKLLANAVEFTQQGSITVEARATADEVVVSVRDTGCGVPEKNLPMIFEPFGKLDHETGVRIGTGLGLYICRRLIEIMGGRIWVISEEGEGAIFLFSLRRRKGDS